MFKEQKSNTILEKSNESHMNNVGEKQLGLRVYGNSAQLVPRAAAAVHELRNEGYAKNYLNLSWKKGSHIDIVAFPEGKREVPWDHIKKIIDSYPTASYKESDEQYARIAPALAKLEGVFESIYPRFSAGTQTSLSCKDLNPWPTEMSNIRHAVLSCFTPAYVSYISDGLLDDKNNTSKWLINAFAGLALAHPFGAEYGAFSLRSHAEAYLYKLSSEKEEKIRAHCESHMEEDIGLVRRVIKGGDVSGWPLALQRGCGILLGATELGVLDSQTIRELSTVPQRSHHQEGRSQFHRAVDATGVTKDPPPWFPAYQVLINLFYQTLPLFSVSARDRFHLCLRVSTAIDVVSGTSWQKRLAETFEKK